MLIPEPPVAGFPERPAVPVTIMSRCPFDVGCGGLDFNGLTRHIDVCRDRTDLHGYVERDDAADLQSLTCEANCVETALLLTDRS
jgi:hypothetical protein